MGIPKDSEGTPVQCQSANLPRSLEKVDFYEETLGFSFTNKDFTEEISELQINSRSRELYYDKIQDLEPDVSRKLLTPGTPAQCFHMEVKVTVLNTISQSCN